ARASGRKRGVKYQRRSLLLTFSAIGGKTSAANACAIADANLQRHVDRQAEQLLQIVIQTPDRDVAANWLDPSLSMSGIEGVVAKQNEAYPKPEAKRWRKVRRVVTTEFEVHGFIPEHNGAYRLVLAIGIGDDARIVGTTYPIGADDAALLSSLVPQSVPGARRIWGPFESDRHDAWFRL